MTGARDAVVSKRRRVISYPSTLALLTAGVATHPQLLAPPQCRPMRTRLRIVEHIRLPCQIPKYEPRTRCLILAGVVCRQVYLRLQCHTVTVLTVMLLIKLKGTMIAQPMEMLATKIRATAQSLLIQRPAPLRTTQYSPVIRFLLLEVPTSQLRQSTSFRTVTPMDLCNSSQRTWAIRCRGGGEATCPGTRRTC